MAEGTEATATATAPVSESAPVQEAAAIQTPQGAGEGAGQTSQQPQVEMVSVPKSDYDSHLANSGRFRQIQERGDLEFMAELQAQGLSAKDVRDTTAYLKAENPELSLGQLLTAIRTPSAPPAQASGEPQKPREFAENDPNRLMTVGEMDRRDNERSQQETAAGAQREQKQFWDTLTTEFKVTGGAKAKSLRGIISDAEQQVIAEDIRASNPYMEPAEALAQAGQYIPSKEQLARARTLVVDDWKDLGNEIVSAAATGQAGLPAGTLGGGAGGALPPPGKAGALTPAQKQQAVLDAIRKSTAAGGYTPPA